ncbi:cytochrome P450 [Auriscalpium vulgare]|uniref:Cytochrome P450 n=1 Tax=Auriscalpium vulgare TaxID=40419 RepID=A0ACB8S7X7_9AGAM|nr:cytochrome P450 [Auriscalpium vulgare]
MISHKDDNIYAVTVLAAAALGALLVQRYWSSPWRKLPPGPRGFPLIGNLLDLRARQWETFKQWKTTYGNVIFLRAAGQPILVLNSQKAAADLLDRRAALYSDRPRNVVCSMIACRGLFLPLERYGERWQRMRRATHESLAQIDNERHFKNTQKQMAAQLALALLEKPEEWREQVHRTLASVLLAAAYDAPPVDTADAPVMKTIDVFMSHLKIATIPGAYLAEFFPLMRHIPSRFAQWKREAETWFSQDTANFEGLFDYATQKMGQGTEHRSLAAILMDNAEKFDVSRTESAWLAGTIYAAGFDTTSTMVSWWFLAMVAHPEYQARAQAEIDAVVGRARVPALEDLPHLPYVRAIIREVLRWRPVGPLGVPHQSVEDDWYDGMFIPAGTTCVPNVWAINHDPAVYGADAGDFNPARHLDANGDLAPAFADTKNQGHSTFGFGKRVCLGRHMANAAMAIDAATILWACKIERGMDKHGKETPLDVHGYVDEGVAAIQPVPFACKVTARFAEAGRLLAAGSCA